ncbi:hypothetical protein AMAG_20654 [Allomyces macrogynus ATCC 38327]|uniref:Uncharacterized protein n=1 Tax=Allomyces macrogynus (strain ATCC 38327) TaxID=578462 RepID=A0A0L0TE92_ALLM3|nr:hypothetical protein AMAG_20654 [Allomyces macrogynus ATCC 38327]|eukprot:KNE72980.1 hypothetical protein AMAG_20654 [Allomyces macrogynus ATCC 38327]
MDQDEVVLPEAVRAPAALRGSMPLAVDPVPDATVPRDTEVVIGAERQLPTPPSGEHDTAEPASSTMPCDVPVPDTAADRVPDKEPRRGSSTVTGTDLGSAALIPSNDHLDHSDRSDADSDSDDNDALHRPPTCPVTTVPIYEALSGPLGSVALSPSARDIAVPTRTGLAILDLYDPYGDPRLVTRAVPPLIGNTQPQLQPAVKVAWNPHLARQQWVASTHRTHVIVWNLTHPGSATSTPLATPPGSPPPTLRRTAAPSDPIVPLAAYTSPAPTPTTTSPPSIETVLSSHTRAVTSLAWSPAHADMLATASLDGTVRLWDFAPPRCAREHVFHTTSPPSIETVLSSHTRAVTSLAWSPAHADMLATASLDGTVRLWDLRRRGAPVNTFSTWGDPVLDVAWNNVNSWRFATAGAASRGIRRGTRNWLRARPMGGSGDGIRSRHLAPW